MGSRLGRAIRLLLAGAMAVSMATGPGAQERDERQSRLVFERNRLNMHPGEPLHMLGIADAKDDFHAGTPTLQSSNGVVARVDLDALYERQLGLASGTVFHGPPLAAGARAMREQVLRRSQRGAKTQGAVAAESSDSSESDGPLGKRSALVVAITAAVALFVARHLRGAGL